MILKRIIKKIAEIGLPFFFGAAILYWMYRETDWHQFLLQIECDIDWSWMFISLFFGLTAQVFRGLRWKLALAPLGEKVRSSTSVDAIFISYATSLIVPRMGEVMRCGILRKSDKVAFTSAFGTVVTERIVDAIIILVVSFVVFLFQIPLLSKFLSTTGTSLNDILSHFTTMGYVVTIICILSIFITFLIVLWRFSFFGKAKGIMKDLWKGIRSLYLIKKKWLYAFYTALIWISYFLHLYLTFFCFNNISDLGLMAGLVVFSIGSFAVLVPTPNGAGPWHFATKTVLVLYGIMDEQAILFALVVHTFHTLWVVVLGIYGWAHISIVQIIDKRKLIKENHIKNIIS